MAILLDMDQLILDGLGDGVESHAGGPNYKTRRKDVFGYFPVCALESVVDLVFFDFGDSSVGDDVYFIVAEFLFRVFADFFIVCVQDMRLRLNDMDRNLISQQRWELSSIMTL